MKRGTKAQLFTLDLLLALIPLTIALGMSANAISGVATQMEDYTHWYSYHRMVNDAMDVLIKTPGEPPDWNSTNSPSILGLANYTNASGVGPYYLDDGKVGALNASVGGGFLYQVGLSQLLGNESFPYLSLSFIGATVNTTNFSIIFTNGSRADVSNIYAAERLALLTLEKMIGSLLDVEHFTDWCCPDAGPGKPPIFYMDFYVTADDLSKYDFWLYAIVEDKAGANSNLGIDWQSNGYIANVTPDCCGYRTTWSSLDVIEDIFPCPGSDDDPGGTPPTCDRTYNGGNGRIKRIFLDSDLNTGWNRLLIRAKGGSGAHDYYLIRTGSGAQDTGVAPEFTGMKAVKVILEVGR